MEAEPPKRRWYQFSLRTLLIVVTLLAVPLGYVGRQAKIVRDRKAWLSTRHGERSFFTNMASVPTAGSPSWVRQLLGDKPQVFILCGGDEASEAIELFPEASVHVWVQR